MSSIENRIAIYLQDEIPCSASTDYQAKARHVIGLVDGEMRDALRDLAAIIRSTTGRRYQYAIDRAERLSA